MVESKSATVENKDLIESALYLKKNNFLQESKTTIKFETVKEAEDEKIEEVVGAINEKMNLMKQEGGFELKLEGITILEVPLKTRVWKATLAQKDLESIFNIMLKIEPILKRYRVELDEKIAEKERVEKEKEEKAKIEEGNNSQSFDNSKEEIVKK
jgi:hypothetical protein